MGPYVWVGEGEERGGRRGEFHALNALGWEAWSPWSIPGAWPGTSRPSEAANRNEEKSASQHLDLFSFQLIGQCGAQATGFTGKQVRCAKDDRMLFHL